MIMQSLIESLNEKLKSGIHMEAINVADSAGEYYLSLNKDVEIVCYQSEKNAIFNFEFPHSNIVNFHNYFDLKLDIVFEFQQIFNDLSFLYSYLFGKTLSINCYPASMKDLVTFNPKSEIYNYELVISEHNDDPYIDKIVFIVLAHFKFDLKTKNFFMKYTYKFNNPYGDNDINFYETDHKQFLKFMLKNYAVKILTKELEELTFRDSEVLKILNYF